MIDLFLDFLIKILKTKDKMVVLYVWRKLSEVND